MIAHDTSRLAFGNRSNGGALDLESVTHVGRNHAALRKARRSGRLIHWFAFQCARLTAWDAGNADVRFSFIKRAGSWPPVYSHFAT